MTPAEQWHHRLRADFTTDELIEFVTTDPPLTADGVWGVVQHPACTGAAVRHLPATFFHREEVPLSLLDWAWVSIAANDRARSAVAVPPAPGATIGDHVATVTSLRLQLRRHYRRLFDTLTSTKLAGSLQPGQLFSFLTTLTDIEAETMLTLAEDGWAGELWELMDAVQMLLGPQHHPATQH
jgi:hypothetical protein